MRIGFTGDLSFSAHFRGADKDEQLLDNKIKDYFGNNDYNVINYESPITPCKITKKKRLAHRCDPDTLDFVKRDIKNPILSFANNHMMDYSYIGMMDSLDSAESWNIPYIGAGRNEEDAARYVILGDDIKVGIIALQYKNFKIASEDKAGPLHESKVKLIKRKISEIKSQVDYTVMVYHGGDEFFHVPMPYIRKQLKSYLDWGCDIVVAHHPHVVQGYEIIDKKAIFYSLGNFIFDTNYQRAQDDTDKGVIVSIDFKKDGFTFDYLATVIDREDRKILVRDADEYFNDIKSIKYSRAWCTEAYRKKEILKKAAELKEEELAKTEEERLEKEKIIRDIRRAAGIKKKNLKKETELVGDDPDEEDEKENNNKSKGTYNKLRKFYRNYVKDRRATRRSLVIKFGGMKAKLLYRNSI